MIYLRRQIFIYLGTPSLLNQGELKPRIKELKAAGRFVLHCCTDLTTALLIMKKGDLRREFINYSLPGPPDKQLLIPASHSEVC